MVFLDYQASDARIKIHHFASKLLYSSKEIKVEPLTESFKLVVVEKHEFQDLDVITNNNFGISGLSRIRSKTRT